MQLWQLRDVFSHQVLFSARPFSDCRVVGLNTLEREGFRVEEDNSHVTPDNAEPKLFLVGTKRTNLGTFERLLAVEHLGA